MQDLLDHTAIRLLASLEEVIQDRNKVDCIQLISKLGCDGSQQTEYKQKFESKTVSDGNIFLTSLVPLRLIGGNNNKKVIWQNPTPSSARYYGCIRINFVKESTDIITNKIMCGQKLYHLQTP